MTYKNLFPIQPNSYNKPDHHNTNYPFFTIGKDMNELLNPLSQDFFGNSFIDFRPLKQDRFPKVDITETKDNFLITADLPGIDEKNVNITLDDGISPSRVRKRPTQKINKVNFTVESGPTEHSKGVLKFLK